MTRLPRFFMLFLLFACDESNDRAGIANNNAIGKATGFETIAAIPPPAGYERAAQEKGSFGEWLRALRLKKDRQVYLYDGSLKRNQSAQFVVLDIPVGKKDLQQCADAVMRMRAEYLFSQGRYAEIEFRDNGNKAYRWTKGNDRPGFERYLENVFSWCGSASLEKQLKPAGGLQKIQPGDVLIRGGFPGHAMIVVDVAVNKEGKKVFMLAQSYMPAQDIHVVKNPGDHELSPWYEADNNSAIDTPEWTFEPGQLRTW